MKKESDFLYFTISEPHRNQNNLIETKTDPPTPFIKMTLLYDPQLTLFRGWAELYTPHLALF